MKSDVIFRIGLVALVLLILIIPVNAFTEGTLTPLNSFDGPWTMNGAGMNAFGDCWVLYQTGSQVTGGYPLQHGRLTGTITGEKLTGYWSDEPTYAAPKDYGWFTVTLGDNVDGHGYSFDGEWGYANSKDSYSFRGGRSATICSAMKTPTPTPTPTLTPTRITTTLTPTPTPTIYISAPPTSYTTHTPTTTVTAQTTTKGGSVTVPTPKTGIETAAILIAIGLGVVFFAKRRG